MTRMFLSFLCIVFSAGLLQVHAQPFVECKSVYYYDKTAPQHIYTAFLPTQTFAVRITPERAGRLDTAIIGFGITKTPATRTTADTVFIRILEDTLPAQMEIDSYMFVVPPDLSGNIPTTNWMMELNFSTGEGAVIKPARDFWVAWRFSGPPVDKAIVLLRKASPASGRSVVISGSGATTPMTTVAWSQVGDTVDLQFEGRICYEPIPVELSRFHAMYAEGKTWMERTTASETNNFGFEVERLDARSEDGAVSLWRKMGFIPGNGTTTMEHHYSFIDDNPGPAITPDGMVRYRLRQIDYDGTEDVSPIQSVLVAGPVETAVLAALYPNPVSPAQDMMTIPFSLSEEQDIRIEVRDILGAVVAVAFNGRARSGHHAVTYQTAELNPGWYSCTLHAGGTTATQRFMVVR